ncbi:hypothetical protein ABEY24_09905 [Peribacillus frigoritolerans]|uniref:hypothetical protein n=1 Tax=Peribacillus frigoritolerans TaxID=450367 RepID=UPI003D276551
MFIQNVYGYLENGCITHEFPSIIVSLVDLLVNFADLLVSLVDLLVNFADLLVSLVDLLVNFADLLVVSRNYS